MAIENNEYNNLFVTNIDDIFKIIMEEEVIFLYDTAAISHHEVAFKRNQVNLLKEYSKHHPIILTETIINELRMNEDEDGRYESFLKEFPIVMAVSEEDFPVLLERVFTKPQYIFAKCRESAVTAFHSIYELAASFQEKQSYQDILQLYRDYFSEKNNDNKGEYSLLWLSIVLRMINPDINVHFVGVDRDLYSIIFHTYYRHESLERQLRRGNSTVEIMSTDSLLYGLTKQSSYSRETVENLCTIYRNQQRKVIHRKVRMGIPSQNLVEGPFDNELFLTSAYQLEIIVVY